MIVNSLAPPMFFGDRTPWQSGFNVIYPSLLVHLVFGVSIGFAARGFVAVVVRKTINSSIAK